MRITNAGNVGIGATAPGARLEVAGQVKITGGTPGAGKFLQSDAAGLAAWADVTSGGGWTDGGTNVYLTATGDNVGIGVTAPSGKLQVEGGTAGADTAGAPITITGQAGGPDGGDVDLIGGAGGHIVLMPGAAGTGASAGNVGIGTTGPDVRLMVAKSNANASVGFAASQFASILNTDSTINNLAMLSFRIGSSGGAVL